MHNKDHYEIRVSDVALEADFRPPYNALICRTCYLLFGIVVRLSDFVIRQRISWGCSPWCSLRYAQKVSYGFFFFGQAEFLLVNKIFFCTE